MEEKVIQWIIADSRQLLSDADRESMNVWRSADPANEQLFQSLERIWTTSGTISPVDIPDKSRAWERFAAANMPSREVPSGQTRARFSWIRVAAVLIVAIGIGLWTFRHEFGWQSAPSSIVYTARENLTIDLPDGSKVFLKSGSSMDVNSDLATGQQRKVRLQGSAFFEVHPDPDRRFIIDVNNQMIQVLGTSFHVRSDQSELDVVVREGHVAVSGLEGKDRVDLLAEQHYHLDRKNNVSRVSRDPSGNAWSWQSGILEFYSVPLGEVLEDIERHYQIQVRLANPSNRSCRFTSRFSDADASTVLQSIAGTFGMELRLSGQGIYYLTDGKCR